MILRHIRKRSLCQQEEKREKKNHFILTNEELCVAKMTSTTLELISIRVPVKVSIFFLSG